MFVWTHNSCTVEHAYWNGKWKGVRSQFLSFAGKTRIMNPTTIQTAIGIFFLDAREPGITQTEGERIKSHKL